MNRWNYDGIRWCGDGVYRSVNWSVCYLVGCAVEALDAVKLVHTKTDDHLNCCRFRGSCWHALGWMCWYRVLDMHNLARFDGFHCAQQVSSSWADQRNSFSSVLATTAYKVKVLLDNECPSLCKGIQRPWRFLLKSRRGSQDSEDRESEIR